MGSMYTAISGLQSSSKWLDVISNNVSNSNTVGYKSARVNFSDMISQGLISASSASSTSNLGGVNPSQLGLGVTVSSIQNIMTQGTITSTGNVTDVAISGNGFFVVKNGDNTMYTRAGNFTFDSMGNLVASDGSEVQGWTRQLTVTGNNLNLTVTGNVDTTKPASGIKIPQTLVLNPKQTGNSTDTADKTTGIVMSGNLDANTPHNAGTVPGSTVAAAYSADATTTATVYDSLGTAHTITFLWTQVGAVGAPASWTVAAYDTTNGKIVADGATANNGANGTAFYLGFNGTPASNLTGVSFNSDGSLAANGNTANPTQNPTLVIPAAALANGSNSPMTVSLNLGTPNNAAATPATLGKRDGITGDAGNGTTNTSTGVYTPNNTIKTKLTDGYSDGTLKSLSFDSNGQILGVFSNEQTVVLGQLALANFDNTSGLTKVGGSYYKTSANSGIAQISTAGKNGLGTITGSALESSNVDLTTELTNMIVAQRMFESNARVVTTADSILQSLVNLGR